MDLTFSPSLSIRNVGMGARVLGIKQPQQVVRTLLSERDTGGAGLKGGSRVPRVPADMGVPGSSTTISALSRGFRDGARIGSPPVPLLSVGCTCTQLSSRPSCSPYQAPSSPPPPAPPSPLPHFSSSPLHSFLLHQYL